MKARHRKPGRPNYRPRSTPRAIVALTTFSTDPMLLVLAVVAAYAAALLAVGPHMAP